jgi:hypothetical protein
MQMSVQVGALAFHSMRKVGLVPTGQEVALNMVVKTKESAPVRNCTLIVKPTASHYTHHVILGTLVSMKLFLSF